MGVNMSNCCFPDGPNSARRVPAAGRQVSMQQTPDTDERISQEMKLEREPSCREAPDSAAMVIDLEKLTAPGAQRSVTARPKSSQDQALLREAQITSPGDPLYNVAMKALWHGCPDVLELALSQKINRGMRISWLRSLNLSESDSNSSPCATNFIRVVLQQPFEPGLPWWNIGVSVS